MVGESARPEGPGPKGGGSVRAKVIVLIVAALLASPLSAQDWAEKLESDLELLGALHQVRAMWVDPDVAEWEIDRWISERIDSWRGPLPDGTRQWVIRNRPETEVVDRSEHLVYGTPDQPATFEDGDAWVYGVRVVVPRKRSLFRGNHRVWVEQLTIRMRDEIGVPTEEVVPVERWFAPNTSQTWDLEAIVPRADVVLEAYADLESRGEALVEIHFLESVESDDPSGPHYRAIQTLSEIAGWLSADRIDSEIERVETRLIPGARSVPVALVAQYLEEALTLIDSEDPEERKKAMATFVEALNLIRGE